MRDAHRANEDAATYLSAQKRDERRRWVAWEGPEVEGRLAGVHTLFLSGMSLRAYNRVRDTVDTYEHVLFGWSFLRRNGWELAFARALKGKLMTVEVNPDQLVDMPRVVREVAHIILRVEAPSLPLDFLKPTDTLRVDRDYLDVATVTYHSMQRYWPSLYNVDTPVIIEDPESE